MENTVPRSIWRNPKHFLAFGFGAGASPIMPGTIGTLVGVLVFMTLSEASLWNYLLITTVAFFLGIWLCGSTAKEIKVHDHPGIVWDEIVGYLIAMIGLPFSFPWIVAGFVLFRAFDIFKPWPIKWIDSYVHGGFGIMLDDVLAGIYTLIVLQFVAWTFFSYN
jgi:phosphatidylglycerophosphatase A